MQLIRMFQFGKWTMMGLLGRGRSVPTLTSTHTRICFPSQTITQSLCLFIRGRSEGTSRRTIKTKYDIIKSLPIAAISRAYHIISIVDCIFILLSSTSHTLYLGDLLSRRTVLPSRRCRIIHLNLMRHLSVYFTANYEYRALWLL